MKHITTKLRIGDNVLVTSGSHKGETGVIQKISQKKITNRVSRTMVTVEGINEVTRNMKAQFGQPGRQFQFFAPIDISNVSLVDPKDGGATRIKYEGMGKNKKRITVKSGTEVVRNVSQK